MVLPGDLCSTNFFGNLFLQFYLGFVLLLELHGDFIIVNLIGDFFRNAYLNLFNII